MKFVLAELLSVTSEVWNILFLERGESPAVLGVGQQQAPALCTYLGISYVDEQFELLKISD